MVDASQRFLAGLLGAIEPEMKRRIIGRIFIEVFQETGEKLEAAAAHSPKAGKIDWLLQGTLYPDVVSILEVDVPLFELFHEFQETISWLFGNVQSLTYAQIESINFKGKSRLRPFSCLGDNTNFGACTRPGMNHAQAFGILATC